VITGGTLRLAIAMCGLLSPASQAQQAIFGRNLIVNPDAEAGPGNNGSALVAIPGWAVLSGTPRVVTYSSGSFLAVSDNGPENRGNNYFAGGPQLYYDIYPVPASLGQTVDLSSAASAIDAGGVTMETSCYLAGYTTLRFEFLNASGQLFDVSSCYTNGGATNYPYPTGLYFGRKIQQLRPGARAVKVTLQLQGFFEGAAIEGYADNLSLVLSLPGDPQALFSRNLIFNGDAETGTPGTAASFAREVPGWVRSPTFTTDTYSDPNGDLKPTDPGSPDRGSTYFWGGSGRGASLVTAYQDIDLSAAAKMIDAGNVTYTLSAWLGGVGAQGDNARVEVSLGNGAGPVREFERKAVTGLFQRSVMGYVSAGVRIARVTISMERLDGDTNDALVDNVSLVLTYNAPPTEPSIRSIRAPGDFTFGLPAPGIWVEVYGDRLAPTTAQWQASDFHDGVAPTSLAGVTVTVNNQPAFLSYVSPAQINALISSDTGTGPGTVVVSHSGGTSAPFPTMVNGLSLSVLAPRSFGVNSQYAVAMFTDGKTYVLPTGSIPGLPSRPAKPGETIVLFGLGFGPVNPIFNAGTIVTQPNSLVYPLQVKFDQTPAAVTYQGLAVGYTGLYQFNVIVPDVPDSDTVPLKIAAGGTAVGSALYTAVRR
jgi:uncharacterized protein (TIGR03437 family)